MDTLVSRVRIDKVGSMTRRSKYATNHDKIVIREYQLQEREEKLLKLLRMYPNHVIRGLAKRQEAEWHYGRLYLVGALTKDQYDAACYLDRVTRAYRMMIKRYGHVKAAKQEPASATTVEDLSQSARKRMKKAKKKYNEVYGALKECGKEIETAIINALEKDDQTDLELLRRGLTILVVIACANRKE